VKYFRKPWMMRNVAGVIQERIKLGRGIE